MFSSSPISVSSHHSQPCSTHERGSRQVEDYRGGRGGWRCWMGQGTGRDVGQEGGKVGKGLMETEEETQKRWRYVGRRERMQRVWAGKRVKRWVGCEGAGNCGRFQYGCLANTICIGPMRMKFCDTLICIHLHKINPPSQYLQWLFLVQKIIQQNKLTHPNRANILTEYGGVKRFPLALRESMRQSIRVKPSFRDCLDDLNVDKDVLVYSGSSHLPLNQFIFTVFWSVFSDGYLWI